LDRRTFLIAAAASVAALACSDGGADSSTSTSTTLAPTAPTTPTTLSTPTTGAPTTTPTTKAPAPAKFVDTGPHDRGRVALTFHTNGDLSLAQQLLDVFAARNVVVTAFIVGEWLEANPTWAKKLLDAGHELANHTYSHQTFYKLSPDAMRDEIVRCRDVITRLSGSPGAFFRPSGTDNGTDPPPGVVLEIAGESGYRSVLGYDVDSLDYTDPGADAVVTHTLATVGPGSIVSMHFGHPGTIAALPRILDGLDAKNLTPVTASKLLG
jgi:peptidoglycan/xylan/chitin deacetylase (PgdA/CDA1 family)